MFITFSAVSAENITDTSNVNMNDDISEESDISHVTDVKKKETNNITKTSASTSKISSKISVDSQSVKYDTTTKFKAQITDSYGNNIDEGKAVFKINGNTIGNANVNNGVATLTFKLSDMTPKKYTLTVKYGENSKYYGSSATTTLTLLKHNSKIVLNNESVITRDTVKLTGKVIDADTGSVAKSGKVAFKINGKTAGYATVSNGIVSLTYHATKLSAKTYKLTASYGGNSFLNSDRSETSYLKVSAIPTRMSVNKVSGYSDSVVLKATVVEKSTSEYLPSGVVVFKINGKTLGNSTITNGKTSFTYETTHLARGTYTITAILKPTSTYASSSAENELTINAEEYFTFKQIKSAAITVRTQFEANKNVDTVYISKSRIALSEFLALMIKTTENLYYTGSSNKVAYEHFKSLNTQSDSVSKGVYYIDEIIDMGERTYNFMQKNNRPPKYTSSVFGNIGFFNLVYTYTRVLDASTSDYLVDTCRVYNWNAIHPSNPKVRTIYITSDVVYNKNKDYAYMNKLKSKLESYGYTVKIGGYGPNSHVEDIWYGSLPDNAVQVSIFSGADAGVIYDISTRSFMKSKESRLMFLVYYSATSVDITGMKFLKRAHDDNYSPSSFTGLANPDIYLKNHGYDYAYTTSVDTIAKSVINYIS
ncbi:Ig-like domain-containing protein [Methanosphaera sp. ISO3-F5]|uniref:Ig-like domain-containing protein n=1 Tax=Methanosphaera sp. ISO3-F5 TaxID=1452353 RepID=UPI002B258564|nr:Ig-like domain-containing protein [Methanosphaera sp. ISO3-F5]WQH64964.1 Ig-like domain-containing protein [Methanosphaera sp. ISO3-F5]